MTVLKFTPSALSDLDDIWRYTEYNWGRNQAISYISQIENTCHDVTSGNKVLRRLPEIEALSGFCKCGSHYIFFIQNSKETVVLTVLHEKMDLIQQINDRLE